MKQADRERIERKEERNKKKGQKQVVGVGGGSLVRK